MKAMLLLKQAKIRAARRPETARLIHLDARAVLQQPRPCVFSAFALLLLDSQSAEYIIGRPLIVERAA